MSNALTPAEEWIYSQSFLHEQVEAWCLNSIYETAWYINGWSISLPPVRAIETRPLDSLKHRAKQLIDMARDAIHVMGNIDVDDEGEYDAVEQAVDAVKDVQRQAIGLCEVWPHREREMCEQAHRTWKDASKVIVSAYNKYTCMPDEEDES